MPSSSKPPHQPTPGIGAYPSQDGGRACGCDPRAKHVCESHRNYIDETKTTLAGALIGGFDRTQNGSVTVRGPDSMGDLWVLAPCGHWMILPRFVAEDLIYELQRRLAERV